MVLSSDSAAQRQGLRTVAIVGGGFAGTMVAVHLLREGSAPLRIVLIERDGEPGRGVAYRDQPECHLLNVRAEAMSALPNAPDHFLDWLNRQYSPCHPVGVDEYLPRRLYGAYLQALLHEARSAARHEVRLDVLYDEATALSAQACGGAELQLRSGITVAADQVVLALGNPGPADPPVADPSFYASARYHGNLWIGPGLLAAGHDERLLLIGSGLTALDALARLRERGHRGTIEVISRRGLLPQRHRPTPTQALGFDPLALPPRLLPLFRALRAEIQYVQQAGGDWRSVIDALRLWTPRLWQRLDLRERRRFLRHLRPYWESHRHRAAPRVLDAVDVLRSEGQVVFRAARPVGFSEHADGVHVQLQPRGRGPVQVRVVDRVFNCTGAESSDRRLGHPLVRSLLAQGLVRTDTLGLGLRSDAHGALQAASADTSSPWLHTLGPLRKGELWETTAVPEIRVQAQALAWRLLRRLNDDGGCNVSASPSTAVSDAFA